MDSPWTGHLVELRMSRGRMLIHTLRRKSRYLEALHRFEELHPLLLKHRSQRQDDHRKLVRVQLLRRPAGRAQTIQS